VVHRDSAANTVEVSASPATAGSSLECATNIAVTGGLSTVTFSYEAGEETQTCGNGVPRLFVVIADTDEDTKDITENTHDFNLDCGDGEVTYTIQASGTVAKVGFVFDALEGSVTYSKATVGGVTLDI
jgi:hypothetical protein